MVLTDSFNRKIDYVRIAVTDRCNLRCVYCIPGGNSFCRETGYLSRETIVMFLNVSMKYGLRKVRLTGGEPLLRADILELVRAIKDLGVEDLSLTTNGIMLGDKVADLKAAGLDRVNISMDTMKPERFRTLTGGGSLDLVHSGISSAEEAGLAPLKINMVPILGLNDDEIEGFAAMTISKSFHVRFIELMPLGDNAWGRERLVSTSEVMKKIISAFGHLTPVGGETGPARNYRIEGAQGVLGFISPMSNHFCDSCNRLRVTARGKLRACLFSDKEADISSARTKEDMEKILIAVVKEKPKGRLHSSSLPLRAMSEIGG